MSVVSGKDGTVYWGASAETPVTDWELERTANLAPYVANDTAGVTKRTAGAKDSRGSFNMADKPSFDEGDGATLFLWDGSTSYTVAVLIGSIRAVANFAGTAIATHAVSFEGNGAIVEGSGSSPA